MLPSPWSQAPAGPLSPGGPPRADPRRSPSSWRVASGALLWLLVAWTLLGNALVCAAAVGSRRLRSRLTHLFVLSLAASDLLVAVLVMPWKAASELWGQWPFGAAFCRLWVASDILCSTASILNLCLISLERYWAIAHPFGYQRRMTRRVALAMLASAWGLALVVSFLPVQLGWHQASPGLNGTWDAGEEEAAGHCDASLSRGYAVASSLVSFYIPVAIMGVTYTRIYRIARLQIRRISSLERAAWPCRSCSCSCSCSCSSSIRREAQVLKTLSLLMGVFVCCWLPFFVLNCLLPFCPETEPPCVSRATFDAFVWVGWANSALNPFIYASDAEFRKVFAGFLRGPGRRRRRRESEATPAESANAGRHPLRRLLGGGEGELSLDVGSHVLPSREMATSSLF